MAFGEFLRKYGVLVAFVVLFVTNAVWQPAIFLQPENLRNLLNQNAAVGIIALGMTLVIISGGIDLSVGSMLALAAALGIVALNRVIDGGGSEAQAAVVASFVTVGAGTVLGAANGLMVAYGRVAPFVATLVGLVGYRSLCLVLASGGEVRSASMTVFPELGRGGVTAPFIAIAGDRPLVITWAIFLFVLAALVAGLILGWTVMGRRSIAVGANETAARYSGINTSRVKMFVYTLLGSFTGLAALTLAARMNAVTSSRTGQFYELDAIAAVVIGGTSLRGGMGRVWGTVVGVLLLGMITNMLVVADISVYWQGAVKGAIILLAVLIQRGEGET